MRILLAGNLTLDPLARALAGRDTRVLPFADLPALMAGARDDLVDDADVVVVLVEAVERAFETGFDLDALAAEAHAHVDALAAFAERHPTATVVAATWALPAFGPLSHADTTAEPSLAGVEAIVRDGLAMVARRLPNVLVLNLARLLADAGHTAAAHDAMRHAARWPWSAAFTRRLAAHLTSLLDGAAGRAAKLIAVDADGTLWGGIVGEDGPGGIVLATDGAGRAFRAVQTVLKALTRRGVLLALVSKNERADVDAILNEHPAMVLRATDFVAIEAGWGAKAEAVTRLAGVLGIGRDAILFLDDNPVERAQMRARAPDVIVPDLPTAPEARGRWLLDTLIPTHLPATRVTAADAARGEAYRARAARTAVAATMSEAEFRASLDIRLTFRVDDPVDVARIAQLSRRTNQFTTTARRFTDGEIAAAVADPDQAVVAVDYVDRFADDGTIGFAVLDLRAGRVTASALSCRVIGRGVEDALAARLGEIARARGHERLDFDRAETGRNAVALAWLAGR